MYNSHTKFLAVIAILKACSNDSGCSGVTIQLYNSKDAATIFCYCSFSLKKTSLRVMVGREGPSVANPGCQLFTPTLAAKVEIP